MTIAPRRRDILVPPSPPVHGRRPAGIQGGKKLGVDPILRAKDMANKEVEHLGVMAYAANFQWIRPRSKPGDRVVASADSHHTRVDQQVGNTATTVRLSIGLLEHANSNSNLRRRHTSKSNSWRKTSTPETCPSR